jgi:hypothetical protein
VISINALRGIYYANFHSHLRYGILFWGGDSQGIKVFTMQKKVVKLMCNVKKRTSCRVIQEIEYTANAMRIYYGNGTLH